MNPIIILYLFIAGFFIWLLMSWAFPRIGDIVKTFIEWIKKGNEE